MKKFVKVNNIGSMKKCTMQKNVAPKRTTWTIIHVNNWGPIFSWKIIDYEFGHERYDVCNDFVNKYFDSGISRDIYGDILEVNVDRRESPYAECSPGYARKRKGTEFFLVWEGKYEKENLFMGFWKLLTQYKKTTFYKPKLWFKKA